LATVPAYEEIFPFIYALPMGYVNAFLLAEEDGLTLIDSGLPNGDRRIGKAIGELGRKRSDLRHILITHHHADHCGGSARLKEASSATTYAHPIDAPIIAGETPRPGPNPASMTGRVLGPLITRLPQNHPQATPVDQHINDGDVLPIAGGVKVLHTPGHTMGHVSFLVEGHGGVLFAGDAAAHMFGRLGKPMLLFTENMDAVRESMRRLAALEFDTACFGHGGVVKGKANVEFRQYVEKMAR
jgi:glyoxylase-like metal-dependent hydrolase (beta-lactamase superfamily II)